MPTWFWLNIPLAAVVFLAVAGIPLWMVLRHPDAGQEAAAPAGRPPAAVPVHAGSTDDALGSREAA